MRNGHFLHVSARTMNWYGEIWVISRCAEEMNQYAGWRNEPFFKRMMIKNSNFFPPWYICFERITLRSSHIEMVFCPIVPWSFRTYHTKQFSYWQGVFGIVPFNEKSSFSDFRLSFRLRDHPPWRWFIYNSIISVFSQIYTTQFSYA